MPFASSFYKFAESTLNVWWLAAFAVGANLMLIWTSGIEAQIRASTANEIQILDLQFVPSSPDNLYSIIKDYGAEGRRLYLKFNMIDILGVQWIVFLFLLSLTVVLWRSTLAYARENLDKSAFDKVHNKFVVAMSMAVYMLATDVLENFLIRYNISNFPARNDTTLGVLGYATPIKLFLATLSVVSSLASFWVHRNIVGTVGRYSKKN